MNIKNHRDNGVYITFNNGIEMSVIWGWGNYCENYNYKDDSANFMGRLEKIAKGSHDVEIMMMKGEDKFLNKIIKKYGDGENPMARVKVEDLIEIIIKCYIKKF